MAQLPSFVAALLNPKAYPENPNQIELVQTHISYLFITDDYVYKVKKPVDFGFLDFTTLEKRKFYCHQELVLNRRLCPDIYLDVAGIAQRGNSISIDGEGEVIEYAVKMRKLPRERMMDRLLTENRVSGEMMARVAQRLAEFHGKAATNQEISKFGAPKVIRGNTEENFVQTEKYVGLSIPQRKYEELKDYSYSFIEENLPLFQKRITHGKIKDCHGDVHSAHVCFSNGLYIFDCIEFNERFRYCDVGGDVAFLAMDVDYHGRSDLSQHFIDIYIEISSDQDLGKLLNFFKCYRACVRGKVESFKLDDPHIAEKEKQVIIEVASRYFDLAHSYTEY